MYRVGEYIVHPGQGVCKVEEIVEGDVSLYKLLPVGQRHPIAIMFPLTEDARLRPVVSREEAESLIERYPHLALDEFHERSIALEEDYFKKLVRHGECIDALRTVKTFRHRIGALKEINKKPPVAYERIIRMASVRALSELSIVLEQPQEDIAHLLSEGDFVT